MSLESRAYRAADRAVRVYLAARADRGGLVEGAAARLRELPEVTSYGSADHARHVAWQQWPESDERPPAYGVLVDATWALTRARNDRPLEALHCARCAAAGVRALADEQRAQRLDLLEDVAAAGEHPVVLRLLAMARAGDDAALEVARDGLLAAGVPPGDLEVPGVPDLPEEPA